MKGSLLIFVLLIYASATGQEVLSVDKTKITIGDQIKATIKTNLSGGREWINAETIWPDTLKNIEIVSGPVWNKDNPSAILATWTLSVFDTGWVRIPSLTVIIQHDGQTDTLLTNDVPLNVMPVEPDSSGLRTIKDIYVQPFSLTYYKRYLPHAAALILVIAGLIYWLKNRRTKKEELQMIPPPPLPHEWAFKALDDLAVMKLWQRGEVKEHYTALTAILREYLERRWGIHAMEQTSDEILTQLRYQELSLPLLNDTSELLSVADLIKFAKADPGEDIHSVTIERVRSFVRETIPVAQEEPEGYNEMKADETLG